MEGDVVNMEGGVCRCVGRCLSGAAPSVGPAYLGSRTAHACVCSCDAGPREKYARVAGSVAGARSAIGAGSVLPVVRPTGYLARVLRNPQQVGGVCL